MAGFEQARDAIFTILEEVTGGLEPTLDLDMAELEVGVEELWDMTAAVFDLPDDWQGDGRQINGTLEQYIRYVVSKWDGRPLDIPTAAGGNPPGPVDVVSLFDSDQPDDVIAFVKAGNPVDALGPEPYRDTLLHLACHRGKSSHVTWLLDAGADPRATNAAGETPLHCICGTYGCSPTTGEELIRAGASVNATDNKGWTPLHVAAQAQKGGPMVGVLLAAGADSAALTAKAVTRNAYKVKKGSRPIDLALLSYGYAAMKALLTEPAGGLDKNGNTLLHLAAANTTISMGNLTEFLVKDLGVDIDAVNKWGWTALHYACNGYFDGEFVSELHDHGATPDIEAKKKHKGHPADATPSTVARAAKNFVAETGRIEVYLKGQKKFLLLEQLLGLTEAS